eukprot:m.208160 g.208160  ORF g.208160 m.208160 type:complete len:861 (+) comp39701_c1_seq7:1491-4073(+)
MRPSSLGAVHGVPGFGRFSRQRPAKLSFVQPTFPLPPSMQLNLILALALVLRVTEVVASGSASTMTNETSFGDTNGTISTGSPASPTSTAEGLGRCELFNATGICTQSRANKTIFVDLQPNYDQKTVSAVMDHLFAGVLQSMNASLSLSPAVCQSLLVEGICTYMFPPCHDDASGKAVLPRMCKETCLRIFFEPHLCHNLFVATSGASVFFTNLQKFDAVHADVSDFQCGDHLPKASDGETCYDALPVFPTAPTETPHSVQTCDGTGGGKECVFPFTYQEVNYKECTTVGLQYKNFRPWCATEANLKSWGNCDCLSGGYALINGTCEVYDGGEFCGKLGRAGARVFVDSRFSQRFLSNLTRLLMADVAHVINQSCFASLARFYCHLVYPDCLTPDENPFNATYPAPLCPESRVDFFNNHDCTEEYKKSLKMIQQTYASRNVSPVHMHIPEYGTLKRARDVACMTISVEPSPPVDIIVSVVLTVVILIALGILICVWYHLRRRSYNTGCDKGENLANAGYGMPTFSKQKSNQSLKQAICNRHHSMRFVVNPDFRLEDFPEVSLESIQYVKDLGEGAFGQVFLGSVGGINGGNELKTLVAVKVLKDSKEDSRKQEFLTELRIMSQLRHPNIITLLGKCVEEDPNCMVLEFMCYGDLTKFLHISKLGQETSIQEPDSDEVSEHGEEEKEAERHILTVEDLQLILTQICQGLAYMARRRYVHRDIATRNCLVGRELSVKIADFGLSRDIYANDYYRMKGMSLVPIRWMAPESIMYGKYSLKSDIWSFGVVVWEVFSFGMRPYYGMSNEEVMKCVTGGGMLVPPDDCPSQFVALMRECWAKRPEDRPSGQGLVEMMADTDKPIIV